MPTTTRRRSGPAPDHELLAAWAWQGIGRLGPEAIIQAAARNRTLGCKDMTEGLTARERAEYRGLWPSERRKMSAIGNASWLRAILDALAGRLPAPPGIAAYLDARGIPVPDAEPPAAGRLRHLRVANATATSAGSRHAVRAAGIWGDAE